MSPDPFGMRTVRAAYDTVADDYADAFADDLQRLPLDREVLDTAAEMLTAEALVLDLGCGPGQVGDYLTDRGLCVIGVDLSTRMLALARQRTGLRAVVDADLRALPCRSGSLQGIVAYYSIQHMPRAHLSTAFDEIHRVLTPNGVFVLAAHLGEGELFSEEFLGHPITSFGGTFYRRDELEDALRLRSFQLVTTRERGPLPNEHPSQRLYVVARRT